jgi:hypothetical protein
MLQSSAQANIFPVATVPRLALTTTQPSVQRIPGVLSTGVKHGQVMLTTHPPLALRPGMSRNCISSPLGACMVVMGLYVNSNINFIFLLVTFPLRMTGNFKVALEHIFIQNCNNAAYKI